MSPATPRARSARLADTIALVVAAALIVAACGGGTPTAGSTSAPTVAVTAAPSDVAPTGAASGAAGTTAPSAFSLEAKEYSFTPTTLTAAAGEMTFTVKNAGTEDHEFEVYQDIALSLGKAEAFGVGETATLTVALPAGTYTFACRLNGHQLLGMTGTLTVE